MTSDILHATWDLYPAISLLSLRPAKDTATQRRPLTPPHTSLEEADSTTSALGLGNFSGLWDFLRAPSESDGHPVVKYKVNDRTVAELDASHLGKAVKWRDELDGADLEDNVEPLKITASNIRTQKRAERRAKARAKAKELSDTTNPVGATSDTATDAESGNELDALRRSPDRSAIIANILGRVRHDPKDDSPPTSPSPPNSKLQPQPRTPKKEWPVSNPFLWQTPTSASHSQKLAITPRDGLSPSQRKVKLIKKLSQAFPDERKYLSSTGLPEPAFTPLNTSSRGIHVFVDISNISIGFHDCLKEGRGMNRDSRVRRVPLDFHNLSLVMERGRPAAKRVLAGSDKTPSITQAMNLGYEANMLERVHKAKELTASQRKRHSRYSGNGYHSASGLGETSGSETNGYLSSGPSMQQAKWVEQAVDEILHLKMLESLVDAAKEPSTIVLATGDAAEAEYSGGFMQQVERALANGWVVEVVSFSRNTSSLYTKHSFRQRWGPMFKLVQLDSYAEFMIDEEAQGH